MARLRPTGAPNIDRAGGMMPMLRPHYPARIARRLAELAESNPSPSEYAARKRRILEGAE